MVKLEKKSLLALYTLFLCNLCFPQVVKSPFPITKLSWSADDRAFSFSEENTVFFRDSENYEFLDSLNIEKISQVVFSREGDKQVMLTMSKTGVFSVFDLEGREGKLALVSKTPYFSKNYSSNKTISQVAFSKDSNYVALALQDNTIDLFLKLRISNESIRKNLWGHQGKIYNITFSNNSKYLISTSSDGNAIVWESNTARQMLGLKRIFTDTQVPAVFLNDSNIIACDGRTSFAIYDLHGRKVSSIDTLHEIRRITPLLTGRYVSVLTSENEIEIYDLKNNKWIGYIPKYSVSDITDFAFNSDCKYILIGTEDGSIFKFILKDVLLHPNEKPKKIIKITPSDNSTSSRAVIEGRSSFVLSVGGNYLQDPFLASADLDLQFRYRNKIEPFFAGLGVGGQFGFAKDEMRDKYTINKEKFSNLNIVSGMVYVPFGIQYSPNRNDFYFLLLFKGGAKMSQLALFKSTRYILGDNNYTYFVSGGTGFIYKAFEMNVNVEYDGIGGLSPSVYAGMNFRLG